MKGYVVYAGYMGYLPSKGSYCLFVTEQEYREIFEETEES